ncbi:MAG TPA: toll/interleukin-1 receptor domain-containing protein [Pyrinomonadaceae bacterium]
MSSPPSEKHGEPAAAGERKYWAFISYSHLDEEWARWLHRAIETYRVPRRLTGKDTTSPWGALPSRLYPVFRDRDELPGASDLGRKIREALHASRFLIVICSPNAAASKWVNEEIKAFKAMGRESSVLCLIVGGEPCASDKGNAAAECFPTAIRFRVGLDGELSEERAEPIAADARPLADGRTNALLKLLAGMLGVGYDDLKRREERRRLKRRAQFVASGILAFVLVIVAYIAMADTGARLPFGASLRSLLDSHEASVFRPVRSEPEVRQSATSIRRAAIARLLREWKETHWTYDSPARRDGPVTALSVWITSQAMCAVARAPEATDEDLRSVLEAVEMIFDPAILVERNGAKFGWRPTRSVYTAAEPSLWTIALLANLLKQPGRVPENDQRRLLEQRLAYTQEVASLYRPTESGGWNTFAQQTRPEEHSAYTSTLALLALLETRAAGLPWQGSVEKRDALIVSTARWLISQFDNKTTPAGWRAAPDAQGPVSDGLTLQIYGLLLRAEAEANVSIPVEINAAMLEHLAGLTGRPLDFPLTAATFIRVFKNYDGQMRDETQAVEFIWHPWAVECATLWLKRAEKSGARVEDRVRVRRSLSYLVTEIEEPVMNSLLSKETKTFVVSETLYGLSAVASP